MAQVILRLKTWIPQKEITMWADQYNTYKFKGDDRSEDFYSTKYRTYQQFTVDTSNFSVTPVKRVGETTMYMYSNYTGELIGSDSDTASSSGLTYTREVKDGYLYIHAKCDVGNPMVPSPNINYEFTIRVSKDGSVRITGKHDGFPGYEFWRKIDARSPELIWSHDPRDTGEGILSLGPPMEKALIKANPHNQIKRAEQVR